jgi:mycothiol synthase
MSSMSLQLPEGLTCRPLTRDDAALVAQLATEDEVALGREARLAAADVLSWWIRFDVSEGSWLVEEAGRPIAIGWIEVHDETAFGASSVRPGAKGRGLGTLLVEHAEMRARERGATRVLQHALGEDEAAHALLERFGYSAARRHYEMAIELSTPPPAPEELPDDLVLDMFRDEDAREFHDAIAEAFADEWGFVPLPFEEWWEMRRSDESFDPDLWFVVRDGTRIAAYARCEAGRFGGGYVGMLGVRRAYRRRGLGLALLRCSFAEFWRRGIGRVCLGVDAENPTGATRLYERAGMHVVSEDVTFEKVLA